VAEAVLVGVGGSPSMSAAQPEGIVLRYGSVEVPVYFRNGVVYAYAPSAVCARKVREAVRKFAYGVDVRRLNNTYIYATRSPRSGLTPAGKKLIRRVAPQYSELAEHNQIELVILGILVGLFILCQLMPEAPICKALGELWWKVVAPSLTFVFGAYLGVKLGERVF